MSGPVGFVLPAAAVGLGALLIQPKARGFFPQATPTSVGPPQPIIAQAVIEEQHHDELRITDHPVEQGAVISDHAIKMPAEVVIRCMWSNSPSQPAGIVGLAVAAGAALSGSAVVGVAASLPATIQGVQSILNGSGGADTVSSIYDQMLALQASRIPFDIFTGKRVYRNMLFASLATESNDKSENSLPIIARCREIIIVSTQVVTLQASVQADPAATAAPVVRGTQNLVAAPNFNAAAGP